MSVIILLSFVDSHHSPLGPWPLRADTHWLPPGDLVTPVVESLSSVLKKAQRASKPFLVVVGENHLDPLWRLGFVPQLLKLQKELPALEFAYEGGYWGEAWADGDFTYWGLDCPHWRTLHIFLHLFLMPRHSGLPPSLFTQNPANLGLLNRYKSMLLELFSLDASLRIGSKASPHPPVFHWKHMTTLKALAQEPTAPLAQEFLALLEKGRNAPDLFFAPWLLDQGRLDWLRAFAQRWLALYSKIYGAWIDTQVPQWGAVAQMMMTPQAPLPTIEHTILTQRDAVMCRALVDRVMAQGPAPLVVATVGDAHLMGVARCLMEILPQVGALFLSMPQGEVWVQGVP